jgi:hypothetical protein
MSTARNLAALLDSSGDVVAGALDNAGGGGVGEFKGDSIAISSDDTALTSQTATTAANIAIGDRAFEYAVNIIDSVAIGENAAKKVTTGQYSVALGSNAASNTTTLNSTVAIGSYAARSYSNSTGNSVYIGLESGYNGGGSNNTAVGANTLHSSSHTNKNTAIGDYAGNAISGEENTVIGRRAGMTGGGLNVCVGASTGEKMYGSTKHTYVGSLAGNYVNSGTQNTALGSYALWGISSVSGAITQNTAIGADALKYMQDGTGATSITNSAGLGYNSRVSGSNQVQLGNSSTTTYAYGSIQNRSDERDKADIADTSLGLDFISKLRPVEYRWDYREDYFTDSEITTENTDGEQRQETVLSPTVKDGSQKRNRLHQGLIAQEVKAVMDDLGVEFGGYQDHSLNGGTDVKSIGYQELIAPMIKAIQELSEKIKVLEEAQ